MTVKSGLLEDKEIKDYKLVLKNYKSTDRYENEKIIQVQQPPILPMIQENEHLHTLMVGVKLPQPLENKQALTAEIKIYVLFDPKILHRVDLGIYRM